MSTMVVRSDIPLRDSFKPVTTLDDQLTCLILRSEHFGWEEIRFSLDRVPFIRVVAETREPDDAIGLASMLHPKLMIAASHAYGRTTTEALGEIRRSASPSSKILVVVTGFRNLLQPELITTRYSTSSIHWEDFHPEFMTHIVQLVVHTNITMSSATIAGQNFDTMDRGRTELSAKVTKNERDILDRLLAGMTHQEIAHKLGISRRTVERNISNLCNKLQVNSPFGLGWKAHQLQLIVE